MLFFHDLDEDVLAGILAYCDVYAVVSFSRVVNKFFRAAALSIGLWQSLLRDLSAFHHIPDLHHIGEYTTAQLVAQVKRLICGPATWADQSTLPPTVSSSKTFPVGGDARLLPGARYFAVFRGSDIQCWDVTTGSCVWVHFLSNCSAGTSWAVDMHNDGHTAVFLFILILLYKKQQELSIVQVDLATGTSEEVFRLELHSCIRLCRSDICTLSGNLLGISVYGLQGRMKTRVLVIDWRKGAFVIFESSPKTQVAFVPRHLIFANPMAPNDVLFVVYTLGSISSRWISVCGIKSIVDDLCPCIRPTDIAPLMVERLEHNSRLFNNNVSVEMTLHSNPIRFNAYKLTFYAWHPPWAKSSLLDTIRRADATGALLTYQLIVDSSADRCLSWARISVIPAATRLTSPISYPGYALTYAQNSTTRIVDARVLRRRFMPKWVDSTTREVVAIHTPFLAGPTPFSYVSLSSSAGAVMVLRTQAMMEIFYYL
ncbi:hypothetical protein B0H19DRAFT_1262234 [Mycena capillaripes]|nr:hypothetical protein B0H19DRAFT_1262234 [Mycena capillaripes]